MVHFVNPSSSHFSRIQEIYGYLKDCASHTITSFETDCNSVIYLSPKSHPYVATTFADHSNDPDRGDLIVNEWNSLLLQEPDILVQDVLSYTWFKTSDSRLMQAQQLQVQVMEHAWNLSKLAQKPVDVTFFNSHILIKPDHTLEEAVQKSINQVRAIPLEQAYC